MSVKRISVHASAPEYSSSRVRDLPEYAEALAEIEKGIKQGEQIEVIITPRSAEKLRLKRPATSVLHALQRNIDKDQYTVFQRAVKGEPWPRIYIQQHNQSGSTIKAGKRPKR